MTLTNPRSAETGERLLKADGGWWYLGPRGVARLTDRHIDGHGALTAQARGRLVEKGICDPGRISVYALTVLTSTACNLGCSYCFQNTAQDPAGGARPPRIAKAVLSSETIGQILDFTRERMRQAGLPKLSVLLFGGEPLLNVRGCRELLVRAADYGMVRASMISNGTLLTRKVIAPLEAAGLRDVQITFDGFRDDHDQIRTTRAGAATYDRIVENLADVSHDSEVRWELRVNVSHHNAGSITMLIDDLAERLDPAKCHLYFSRVGDVGIGYENDLRFRDDTAEQFVAWHRRAAEAGFRIAVPTADLPCQTCAVVDGRYGAVVSADGTLSSCWETAGRPGLEVGSVVDGYLPANVTAGRWTSCEDSYQYADAAGPRARFRDQVDAAVLDYLAATGRLRTTEARRSGN